MSDQTQVSVEPNSQGNANLIYILYLVAIAVGVTGIVGVVMAYMAKGEAKDNPVLLSHYNNQINIFWKYLLYILVGIVLSVVFIGFLIILAALVWFIIRNVKGMQALSRGQAIENPGSWGI